MQQQTFDPATHPIAAFIEALDESYEDIKDEQKWIDLAQRMNFKQFSERIETTLLGYLEINLNRREILSSLTDSNNMPTVCKAIFPYSVTRLYTEARLSVVNGLSPLTLMPYI